MQWLKKWLGWATDNPNTQQTIQTDTGMSKFLIVGLGNIGGEYANTRHNVGFKAVDALVHKRGASFAGDRYGDVAEYRYQGRIFVVLKPNTYMNLSGKAVQYWLQKKKIDPANLLVVLDDLNVEFGLLRLRPNGSDGGHNGLKNINEILGSQQYARLRVGISGNFAKGRQVDYVLGEWTDEEQEKLPAILERAAEAVEVYAQVGIQQAMNKYNGK